MRNLGAGIVSLLCLVVIAGCTTNKSIAPITTSKATLEMAVGTLNDSQGTLTGTPGTYLNVVSSFRNIFGNSPYQNPGTATLTTPNTTLFGCGLFSYGQSPTTIVNNFFTFGPGSGNSTTYPNLNTGLVFGLPPSHSPADQNGIGYELGFWYFFASDCQNFQLPPAPAAGNYTASTEVPVNGGNVKYSASATLPNPFLVMPNATGVTTFVTDGKGGGTFTIGNPLRVKHGGVKPHGIVNPATEYLIVVDAVVSSGVFQVASVETTNTTATITGTGDCSTSAGGSPIPCGSFVAYVIEADYPLVEAGPPANTSMKPTLTGTQGTTDLSVSGTAAETE